MVISFAKATTVTYKGISYNASNVQYRALDHVRYNPGDDSGQRLALYYPAGSPSDYAGMSPELYTANSTKWCFMIHLIQSGFSTSANDLCDSSVNPILAATGVDWQLVSRGVVVVNVQVTSPNTANGTAGIDSGSAAVPNGGGYYHAPGGICGYYESRNRPSGWKDIIMATEWVQWYADRYNLDKNAWGIEGDSSGMSTAGWVAFAPNRAGEMGTGDQGTMSTVPNVVYVSRLAVGWFDKYDDTPTAPASPFPGAESGGVGFDDTRCTAMSTAPLYYKRTCGWWGNLSRVGTKCIPHTIWASLTPPPDQNFSEPFIEKTATSAYVHTMYFGYLMRNNMPRGLVNLIVGTASKVDGNSITIDPSLYDTDIGDGTVTDPGAAGVNTGIVVDEIIGHLRDQKWDVSIPQDGICRRSRVNQIGRCSVPARSDRTWVELAVDDQNDLIWGDTMSSANGIVKSGDTKIIRSSGNLWLRSRGGGQAMTRYIATEVPK